MKNLENVHTELCNAHCSKKTTALVTFSEEILNGKIHFLCSGNSFLVSCKPKHYNFQLWAFLKFRKFPETKPDEFLLNRSRRYQALCGIATLNISRKTSRKIKIFNADADARMPMPRFPNAPKRLQKR